MKISIAEVKRRLAAGVLCVVEFVGRVNGKHGLSGQRITRRRIVSNGSEMVSLVLDGPNMGQIGHLKWRGVTADEREGIIYLTMTTVSPPDEFLKITIATPKPPRG